MARLYAAPRIVETWPLSRAQAAQHRSGATDRVATAVAVEVRLVGLLRGLFVGRDDAFLDERNKCVKKRLTHRVIRDHLRGRRRIGAYSLLHGGDHVVAKLLAFDMDGKTLPGGKTEALRQANAVAQVFEDLGLPAYLELSRSGLGFHVWVFYGSNAVSLDRTQHLGRLVLRLAGLPFETEIFPKGTSVDQYGATLYMPMHNFLSTGRGGALFVKPDGTLHEDQLQWLADVQCVTAIQVEEAICEAERRLPQLPPEAQEASHSSGTKVDTARILQGVPEGQRDKELFRLACRLRQADVPQEMAERLVTEAAANCTPSFPAKVALEKVRRAYARYAPAETRGEPWAPPTPFHTVNLPSFPTDALPDWLERFVEAEAIATQTPPDLAGGLVLAVAAAAVAGKVEVQVKEGWTEPVNLFQATVQPPGTRKSSVFSHVVRPLEEYERREAARMKPLIEEAQARRSIAEERAKRAQKAAARESAGHGDLHEQAVQAARELAEIEVPLPPRLIVDDCSPERLATLLRDHGGRIAAMSPEGDVFDLMAGRYSGNSEPNLGVYLKGHAGDTLRVDRVGRPPEYVARPALTMGLAVQPFVLRGLANRPGFRGRGLLGRFLYAVPKNLLGIRDIDPPSVPPAVKGRYERNVQALLCLCPGSDGAGHDQVRALRLSADAWGRFKEFLSWLEPLLGEHAELGSLTDWGGKLGGAVARLAGVFHLAEHAGEQAPWDVPIDRHTIEQAIRVGEYYLAHARAAFAEMGSDPEVEDARHILAWIERHGVHLFSKRDAFEGTKGRFKQVKMLDRPLELLVEHGYIREACAEHRKGRGRPASPVFEVNPHLGSDDSPHRSDGLNSANSANSANDNPDSISDAEDEDGIGDVNSANSANGSRGSIPELPPSPRDPVGLGAEPEFNLGCDSQNSQYSHNSLRAAPDGPCRACRTVNWWPTPAGDWVCGTCHPRV